MLVSIYSGSQKMTVVAEILKAKPDATVQTIAPDASVLEALRTMADKHIGALLVVQNGHIEGIFTEHDAAGVGLVQQPHRLEHQGEPRLARAEHGEQVLRIELAHEARAQQARAPAGFDVDRETRRRRAQLRDADPARAAL